MDVASDTLAARDSTDKFLAALLNSRDSDTEQRIQARNWLTEGLDLTMGILSNFLRRDVSTGIIAARNDIGANEYLAALLNSRELNEEQALEARNWLTRREMSSLEKMLKQLPPTNDVELSTRSSLDELVKLLKTRELYFK
jgi:hypothetical protein